MVTLKKSPAKVTEVDLATGPDNPEVAPLFYWIPCPGVRYYTCDYQPALQKMTARWAERPEDQDPDYIWPSG